MGYYTHPDQSPPDLTPAEIAAQLDFCEPAISPLSSTSTLSNNLHVLLHHMKSWPGVIDDIIGGLVATAIMTYVPVETRILLILIAAALFILWFAINFPKGFFKYGACVWLTFGIISAVFEYISAGVNHPAAFIITILAAGTFLYLISRQPYLLGRVSWHISFLPVVLGALISTCALLPGMQSSEAAAVPPAEENVVLTQPSGELLRPHPGEDSRPVPPTLTASPTPLPTPTSTAARTRKPTLPSPTATAEPRCPRLDVRLCTDCTITILDGDKLSCLAVRARVSIDLILAFNPHITNPDLIFAGDSLYIPDPSVQFIN